MKNSLSIILISSTLSLLQSCIEDSLQTEIINIQDNPILYIKKEYLKDKNIVIGKTIEWINSLNIKTIINLFY